jgi:heme exporter protein D
MFVALAVILAIAWAMGFLVFHVSTAAIHLLILLAVIAIVVSVVQRRRVV